MDEYRDAKLSDWLFEAVRFLVALGMASVIVFAMLLMEG